MLKGILAGVGIILVCPLIPVAHFVLVPISPFIAGYFGIGFADQTAGSDEASALLYGVLLGAVFLVVGGIAALLVTLLLDPAPKFLGLIWGGLAIFVLYTGSMACLGAMFARLRRRDRDTPAGAS